MRLILFTFILTSFQVFAQQSRSDTAKVYHSIYDALENADDVRILDLNGVYTNDSLILLKQFNNLHTLTIRNYRGKELPSSIGSLHWLKRLRFINGDFYDFPIEYSNLEHLEAVELIHDSHLELNSTFFMLNRLPELKELRIEGLPAQSFSEGLKFPGSLEILSLRNNHLNNVPVGIKDLSHLKVLDLGANELMELPTFIQNFGELKVIYLDHEPFLRFDQALKVISNCPNLKEIHLEGNNLNNGHLTANEIPDLSKVFLGNKLQTNQHYTPNLNLPAQNGQTDVQDGSLKIKF